MRPNYETFFRLDFLVNLMDESALSIRLLPAMPRLKFSPTMHTSMMWSIRAQLSGIAQYKEAQLWN